MPRAATAPLTAAPASKPVKDLSAPPAMALEVPPGLKGKVPKTLAAVADLFYTKRQERLAADKVAAALKDEENYLQEYIIQTLPKSQAEGVSGKLVTVTISEKKKPIVTDWTALYAYISKTKSFDLLQRRLGEGAVQERWNNKKEIPGVGTFTFKGLSVTKRKS